MNKTLLIIAALVAFQAQVAMAEMRLIGNTALKLTSLTKSQVKSLYLGKVSSVNGIELLLTDSVELQKEFLGKFVGKSKRGYIKVWSKKMFSEGATPPKKFKTAKEVLEFVKSNKNAIGYTVATPGGVTILFE